MSTSKPVQRAALRPISLDDLLTPPDEPPALDAPYVEPDGDLMDVSLHALCEDWAQWTRSRRFRMVSPPAAVQTAEMRALVAAIATPVAELQALHIAICSQPPEALDRRVFEMHYITRVMNIKAAAAAMRISRNHWYRLISAFRRRVYSMSLEILSENESQLHHIDDG